MFLKFLKPKFQAVITIIFAVLEEGIRLQSRKKVLFNLMFKNVLDPWKEKLSKKSHQRA